MNLLHNLSRLWNGPKAKSQRRDLLISGTTVYDDNHESLARIYTERTSGDSLADRIERISTGSGALASVRLESGVTAFVDARDEVFGDPDDWVLGDLLNTRVNRFRR